MDVAAIQRALSARGYDPGPIDGDAGEKTIAATIAFQRAHGLVPDGIAGELTQAALRAATPVVPRRAAPAVPAHLAIAYADIGIKEGVGKANNPAVLAYFADAGFPGVKDDAVAWCAAAAGAWLKRAGLKPSGSLAARSYEGWGVGLARPALGAVGVKKRAGSAWQGHVGLIVGASTDRIVLLGANQNDRVSIASFPRDEFTAFRWASELPLPTDWTLPTSVAGAEGNVRQA